MRRELLSLVLAGVFLPAAAHAHITVWPRQSDLGAREKYVVRAPNEKKVDTVRIEAVFPHEARITQLEQTPGWTLKLKRDGSGAIVGAAWTGALPPDQFAEFGVLAANPKTGTQDPVPIHICWNIASHVQAQLGVDNLLARRYFLFHPFPQQSAVAGLKYVF